jgi:hypothetical protein
MLDADCQLSYRLSDVLNSCLLIIFASVSLLKLQQCLHQETKKTTLLQKIIKINVSKDMSETHIS